MRRQWAAGSSEFTAFSLHPGKQLPKSAQCRDRRRSRGLYVREKHPPNRLSLPVPSFRAGEAHGRRSRFRRRPAGVFLGVRVSSFPSGILCIFRFQSRAVCRETCAWCAACRRAVPSESMETSRRIWEGRSFAEDITFPVLSENIFPQSLGIHLWCSCSFPYFLIWLWWQYGHLSKKQRDLFRRSKACSEKGIQMVLSGSSGTSQRGKLLYHSVPGPRTPMI